MRNLILTLVVVGALSGLAVAQYHFLRVAIKLEKVRFDREATTALLAIAGRLEQSPALIRQWQATRIGASPNEAPALADSISWLADSVFLARGLPVDFSFAIKEGLLLYPVLLDADFKGGEEERYRTYSRLLKGELRETCGCDLFLFLQVNNLFPLLMNRLYGLFLPSLAFLLLLLAALLILVRMLAQLKKLDEVKNDFINNLAHELKTPVFSSSLLLKLLRQSIGAGDRNRSEEYLSLLQGENSQLKGHIDKVLELASLETARYELQLREHQLHPLLEQVIRQYRHKAETRGGALHFTPGAARSRLLADEHYLRSAIQNLLDNALRYGGEVPDVAVATRNEGRHVLISVSDNGPGIAPQYQGLLFRKFYRIPETNTRKAKGFGLGLGFTRQVARAHGGTVRVDSKAGEGSTFTLMLPVAGQNEPTQP